MNNEIRMARVLPQELENEVFDLQDETWQLLEENKIPDALAKITEAWELLPEPKFNTSCSHIILCDLIQILNVSAKHEQAKMLCKAWIEDLKTSGYKIIETKPFLFLGETYLYLKQPQQAKEAFLKTMNYGATKRDFSDKPAFYFDIVKKKLTDIEEIQKLFDIEIAKEESTFSNEITELSDAVSDQIESMSEEGNGFFDDEDYENAIAVWKKALALIPQPQNIFAETLWLETSIGDAYFMLSDHENAMFHILNAKANIEENVYENPFIMLRTGQLYFEANDLEKAKEYLLRAYMLEGKEIFEGSKEKYFEFLQKNIEL